MKTQFDSELMLSEKQHQVIINHLESNGITAIRAIFNEGLQGYIGIKYIMSFAIIPIVINDETTYISIHESHINTLDSIALNTTPLVVCINNDKVSLCDVIDMNKVDFSYCLNITNNNSNQTNC